VFNVQKKKIGILKDIQLVKNLKNNLEIQEFLGEERETNDRCWPNPVKFPC
jgi:hypothetical protein